MIEYPTPFSNTHFELVDRLLWIVDQEPPGVEDWWLNHSVVLIAMLGGSLLEIAPDDGRPVLAGTVGAEIRQGRKGVGRDGFLIAARARICEVIETGVMEPFLVRALRDACGEVIPDIDHADERRAEARQKIQDVIDSPELRERFRSRLSEEDQDLSAKQLIARLETMMESSMVEPVDADEAARGWAMRNAWQELVDAALPDRVIDAWLPTS